MAYSPRNANGQQTMANSAPVTIASNQSNVPVSVAASATWRAGFDKTIASNGVDTADMTLITAGTGHAVSQTTGSLSVVAGTTARSEAIVRSVSYFTGDFNLRYFLTLSQRIANNNFFVEMVDVIGDSLAYSIGSATAITVTIPSNPFTSAHVGQSMYIGALVGTGTFLSGRYPIASVSGNDVTFTVSGFAVGTGTCSLFGWNYHHIMYNGVTATNGFYDTQRRGWATGDSTLTINTTASGHAGVMAASNATAVYLDQVGTSATSIELSQRGSRVRNIPDSDVRLYVQVRSANATSAPATSTTMTVGYLEVTIQASNAVTIANISPQSQNIGLPVNVVNTATVTGTVTANLGTGGTGATSLGKAEDAAHTTGDTGVPAWAVRNDGAATTFTSANGDYSPIAVDGAGVQYVVQKAATGTTSNVTSSATTVTILAANTARKGGSVYNDSSAILYLKFGATASTTSFTVPLAANTYFEIPGGYTGIIDGIWASANGAARVTELT